MTRLLLIACVLAGCTKASGPDGATIQRLEERVAALEARGGGTGGTGEGPAAPGAPGTVPERLARVEAALAKYHEALEFLNTVYEQQKQQQAAQEANEPDPTAVFAVDISKPLAAGQVEGPANALVTIVEAWDFG